LRIHALQTGTVEVRRRQLDGAGKGRARLLMTLADRQWTRPLPIYAWAIEHPEGVIVVDTGETARASEPGYFPRWHPYYRLGVRSHLRQGEEVGARLEDLGISPAEVRWVVLTHLHTDHAGGLHHFPDSEIVVSHRELDVASGLLGRLRGYLPHRFPDWFRPRELELPRRALGPFTESIPLTEAGDVVLVATPGHSPGHLSVVVLEDELSIFIAGDTSYTQELMLRGAVDGVAPDVIGARMTVECIRTYSEQTPVVYLPSHDPDSARRLTEREVVGRVGERARQVGLSR
jgi:N-acyl homoserine lactone hydrolase